MGLVSPIPVVTVAFTARPSGRLFRTSVPSSFEPDPMNRRLLISSVAYGLLLYFLGRGYLFAAATIAGTYSFVAGVPLVVGYLTARGLRSEHVLVSALAGLVPVAAIAALLVADDRLSIAMSVMMAPLLAAGALAGGLLAHARRAQQSLTELAVVLLLPLIGGKMELQRPPVTVETTTSARIESTAPVAQLWDELTIVDSLQPNERSTTWFSRAHFPSIDAIALELPQEGAHRTVTVADGASLREVITAWEPEEELGVAIDPTLPSPDGRIRDAITFDSTRFHLRDAHYRLQPIDSLRHRVIIEHRHALTSRMSGYLGWWAEHAVRDAQERLLLAIKTRAESPGRAPKEVIRAATLARQQRESAEDRSSNSLDVGFSVVGAMDGRTDVYADSIVVLVRDGYLRAQRIEPGQRLDSITASLAQNSGASWIAGKESNAVVLEVPNENGQQLGLGAMLRFTVPRDRGESLEERWVVFTYHLTVPKTPDNEYGKAWTYTHARKQ